MAGSNYPIKPIDNDLAKADIISALAYGNHKSASGPNSSKLAKLMSSDFTNGWLVPLLPEHALQIPNAVVAPMGIAEQDTLDAEGRIVPKSRPTHDLSFPGKHSQQSVNSRIVSEDLEPCNFGKMHRRILHYIVRI